MGSTNQVPCIEADITFLTHEEGERRQPPAGLSSFTYRPHLVVQSTEVRQALYRHGRSAEDYLGVVFIQGPAEMVPGHSIRCLLSLVYYPEVDYSLLQSGATFTVREGGNIVGFGTVLFRIDPPY